MKHKRHIGHEVHTLDNMIGRWVSCLFEKDGITHMQGWIIGYLFDHSSENVFQKDIEAQLHIARSTATEILQLMEKRGFLYREPYSSDARLKRLVLTEKGISHQLGVIQRMEQLEAALKEGIPQDHLEIFLDTIQQLKQNIEKQQK